MEKIVKELYKVNSEISTSKKLCIFGTGVHARQTYVELATQGIKVDYFADRDAERLGDSYMGLPLMSEEKLKELDVSVIIASTAWEDISKRLMNQGITNLFVDLHRYGEISIKDDVLCSVGKYAMDMRTLYILCPAGIGDTLYVAAFAKVLKECRKDMNKICLITKKNHECIGDFFEGVDEVIASNSLVEQLDLYSITTQTWYLKNYIYGHFKKNLCQTLDAEWYSDTDKNMISFYKRKILKLPHSSELERMKLPVTKECLIPKKEKTIIFMPYAATVPLLPDDFWSDLAKRLLSSGYTIYTNIKDQTEHPVCGTYSISESIVNTVALCSQVSAVIALRSGMCDVLAMTKVPLVILNTDERCALDWDVTKNIRNEDVQNLRCYGNYDIIEIKNKIIKFLEK